MTDWNSGHTLHRNAVSYGLVNHAFFGLYAWEWFVSLDFDLSLLFGKRKFRWPMVSYLWGRYSYLAAFISLAVLSDSPSRLNCAVGNGIAGFLFHTAPCVASLNLSLRTMAVWNLDRRIMVSLALLIMAHLAIALRLTADVRGTWVDGRGCVVSFGAAPLYALMYIYTMLLDLIILVLTAYKLWWVRPQRHIKERSDGLVSLLFKDGMVYFLTAFVVNAIAVVFTIMRLNPIMGVIADAPATAMTMIVAGRVVRRLWKYNDRDLMLTRTSPRLVLTTVHVTNNFETTVDTD